MSSRQTDNSEKDAKISVRLEALNQIPKDEIRILDAFHGKGVMWKEISKLTDKTLHIDGIEIERGKSETAMEGNNLKIMPTLDLSDYDLIDLDAYGSPIPQLDIVFKQNPKGCIIVYTFILTMHGGGSKLMRMMGLTDEMQKKSPTACKRKLSIALYNYLAYNKINEVNEIFVKRSSSRKWYGWFRIPE